MRHLITFIMIASAAFADTRIGYDLSHIEMTNREDALWIYKIPGSDFSQKIEPPVFEINGQAVTGLWAKQRAIQQTVFSGIIETIESGPLKDQSAVQLSLKLRVSPDNPVVRFQYVLSSENGVELTKTTDEDNSRCFQFYFTKKQRLHNQLEWKTSESVCRLGNRKIVSHVFDQFVLGRLRRRADSAGG